jgi:hypothetical protein
VATKDVNVNGGPREASEELLALTICLDILHQAMITANILDHPGYVCEPIFELITTQGEEPRNRRVMHTQRTERVHLLGWGDAQFSGVDPC